MFGRLGGAVSAPATQSPRERRQQIHAFGIGVCVRLAQRMAEMGDARAIGRSEAARATLEREGAKFVARKAKRGRQIDAAAYHAGREAANGAHFHKPLANAPTRALA